MNIKKCKIWLSAIINIPANLLFIGNSTHIYYDINNYLNLRSVKDLDNVSLFMKFHYCLSSFPSFSNVFYYRMSRAHASIILCYLCKMIKPPLKSIELDGDFDEGLFLAHNYCVLVPKKAGKNLTVMQGVTIGVRKGQNPILGDNVYIGANACIFGGITIGNNVKIGAGTVVFQNVPDNCTVVGNPARIIETLIREN